MSNDQPPPENDPFGSSRQPPPENDPFGSSRQPPPENDPFRKPPPPPDGDGNGPPHAPPYDPNAHGAGGPYGGTDPLAGMPPLAPFGTRLLARIIDIVIVFIPLAIISLITGGAWYSTGDNGEWDNVTNQMNTGRHWVWSLVSLLAYAGYDTFMTKKYGQTLGKRWLKIRVAMLNDGANPDTRSSLLRAAVLWVPALICCFLLWWLVLLATVLASRPYRQGLHDKAAGTVVVSAQR
ncbi:RDD family protein [Streptomyces sp. NPDC088554]|uniref:RDD family protein n=1 Tax=Streptomyces sp. NPDC088554 TaxID=3365865 RepID=UPI0037F809B3